MGMFDYNMWEDFFLEFEDANGAVPDDEGDESDFSMEDDTGAEATSEPAAEETPAEPTDEPEGEDFSMDDENEGETQ